MEQVTIAEILNIITKVIDDDIKLDEIDCAVKLDDQGLDSLDMMNIFFEIQDVYGVEISEEAIENNEWITVDKILKNLNERHSTNT